MRIAIVNDLRIALAALKAVVASRPDLALAWTAENGREAVERAKADRPDLILMDMVMPEMDGVEATRRIMREAPCPILVVTATIEGNAGRVYDALGSGALDAVVTPTLGADGSLAGARELLRKIDHVRLLHGAKPVAPTAAPPQPKPVGTRRILAIGASTGGPQAVATLLEALPKPFPHPILLVQHVGDEFVRGLAEWLESRTGIATRLVLEPTALTPGTLHLAGRPGHLVVEGDSRGGLRAAVRDEPREHLHRPAVDELFRSLADGSVLGVAALLTGMGRDGAEGLLALRRRGWWTIAQDRETSVVWGMPGEAARIGAACETLPIGAIGRAIAAAFAQSTMFAPSNEERRP